jgi:broad specificity phosphatase PhoE
VGKLILVRHGESEGNVVRVFTTTPMELPLTDLGRRQARAAADKIARLFKPELVVASSYIRARHTGEIIASALDLPIEIEHELHERDMGGLVGKPYDAIVDDPAYDPKRPWEWKPPGGETLEEVRARTAPVLDRLAAQHAGREIVVVSHGGVMAALWAHVTGSWEDAHVLPNAGIVLIEHSAGRYLRPGVVTD